ncbi:TetR family transcriptional regulator [Winogradskyella sp. 3972H.M.0a.05]|uniref:TetR/AcrR family transcriptional regulator n=1 Tax=Winogradskyella sp. 3972H.M.0a.05 TaxID=2950277 RepID=UPI00339AA1B6
MDRLLSVFKITVPEKIFLKDPESSSLGKKIVSHGIDLIDEIGFEAFTFKKLGAKIGSNESSIYRYFESKHKFLLYLSSWYWAWIEYQLVFETHNVSDKKEKLTKAIHILTRSIKEDSKYSHINEVTLSNIIINENSKSFMTKEVDQENKEGYFEVYKRLVHRLRDIISDYNPEYKYSSSLASTVLDGALHQHFLRAHFTSMTDCDKTTTPSEFFIDLTINTLNP